MLVYGVLLFVFAALHLRLCGQLIECGWEQLPLTAHGRWELRVVTFFFLALFA